jgi:mannose-6-phosphate isomerase
MLRPEHAQELPPVSPGAAEEYTRRCLAAFPAGSLSGLRIMVWQHSAVGRDILPAALEGLGAQVVAAGRNEDFMAVDTEAVDETMLAAIQSLVDATGHAGGTAAGAGGAGGGIEAVVSTDGDGDRPLLFIVENGRVRFVPGDLLGVLAAGFLGARHAAVPVNVNDAVDEYCRTRGIALVKTRIGSPHVIAAMTEVAWEANGGFLSAVPLDVPGGGRLEPLPTRDSLVPLLSVLCAGRGGLPALVDSLPRRFGSSAVVRGFHADTAREIMRWLSPADPATPMARFEAGTLPEELASLRARAAHAFADGTIFGDVEWMDWMDGVRVGFTGGDIVHLRPSGNAPEMRIYAVSSTAEKALALVSAIRAEGGVLGRLTAEASERTAISAVREAPRPIPLHGTVQHYEWGGREFIPRLIGEANPSARPFAELWMGAHPRAPAIAVLDEARIPLDRLIAADPFAILGPDGALRFAGRLPYLFKVLDVRVMASIQSHPTRAQAEEGFARENAAGIPVDAPNRNYRDENHKPEVHVALTPFWLLHGFRPLEEIAEVLGAEPELSACMPDFDQRRRGAADTVGRSMLLRDLYARVMTMPQAEVDAILGPLVGRLEAEESRGELRRENPGYWALRAVRDFPLPDGHRDRGIFSIYLLNLVSLKPGQGTFQPAGTLHAYLEGADVELMANSDNVLRGGLTPKHVDVPELLSTLDFRDGRPPIMEGRAASETGREYETPTEEFALERIEVSPGVPWSGGRGHGVDTLLTVEGAAAVVGAGRTLALPQGRIALIPAGMPYSVAARSPRAVLFRAGIPAA